MSTLAWSPFWTLFKREIHRTLRVIYETIAAPLVSSLLYFLIFGVSLGKQIQNVDGVTYFAFLIPGLVTMGALKSAFDNSSGLIVVAKFCNELEDYRIVPISAIQMSWASGLASTVRAFIVGGITFFVGFLFYYYTEGVWLIPEHPFLFLFFLFMGSLAFAHLGLGLSMIATNYEQVSAINTFILLPLIYLGGIFFSLDQLPPFWRNVSELNPFLYIVSGVRYGLLGIGDGPLMLSFVITFVAWALSYLFSIYSLKTGSYRQWG